MGRRFISIVKRRVARRFISIVCPYGKEEWLVDLYCDPNGKGEWVVHI